MFQERFARTGKFRLMPAHWPEEQAPPTCLTVGQYSFA
jgi:hypothetical protein